jgi:hypothetical protein
MPLPKIDMPIFETKLPSSGKTIYYRPFTVKEEKILLIAQESKDLKMAINSVKQIVNNCIIDANIEDFAIFDLEYILLLLRSKSVDNNVKFAIKDPETQETVILELDLNDVKVTKYENHTNKIKINEEYTLILKYPTIEQFIEFVEGEKNNDPLFSYKILKSCLDKIVSKEEVYNFSDYSSEEIDSFLDNLSGEILLKIKEFFDTMPKLRHEMKYKNKNGTEKTFVLEGMQSFFI